ncbi:AfsR/SARP family transcriptional regulator [Nonomuraea sp. NPDC002799]
MHGLSTRDLVAGSLWPETREAQAQADLRTALWRTGTICPGLVVGGRSSLRLDPRVRVDVAELQALTRRLHAGHPVQCGDVPAYGVLLPGWYDEWIVVARERLRQLQLHALEELAEQFLTRGAYGAALDLALTAVEYEPLRQSCQHLVARIHIAEGNYVEAVRSVRAFKELLWDELGVLPSPELLRLVAR